MPSARNDESVSTATRVRETLGALEKLGSRRVREQMERQFAIHAKKSWGIPMAALQKVAKSLGTNRPVALALWDTGWYEARLVAAYVDDPALVTPSQMDRWCRDFDNWGIVDTACFVLFDRTPHAWAKAKAWAGRREEFPKRAGYVLMACLALHDKKAGDAAFLPFLPLCERAAEDDRNFVKKGVSWALRSIGRRSRTLNDATVDLARRLADSPDKAPRSLGKEVLRELTSPKVTRRLTGETRG